MTNISGKSNWILCIIFLFYCDVILCKFSIFFLIQNQIRLTDVVMNFDVKAKQRSYIKFWVQLGRTPVQTTNLLKQAQCGRNVSRALVNRWHKRFSEKKLFMKVKAKVQGDPRLLRKNKCQRCRYWKWRAFDGMDNFLAIWHRITNNTQTIYIKSVSAGC